MTPKQCALGVSAATAIAIGCQGNFAEPTFMNPNDPANGRLPRTPDFNRINLADVEPCTLATQTPKLSLIIRRYSVEGTAAIQIYRSTDGSVDLDDLMVTVPVPPDNGNPDFPIIDADGLVLGTRYTYRVRGVGDDGALSLFSRERSGRPECEATAGP